ncbi:OmpA family protein [Sorangium cellulosum]|uniref:OmpA/MotB family protein n=1 Tax=Sorangium cellulosum TaxID=56 RepID=UPI001F32016E|nr:OmpA family protein [Sorangium cellulosum]
MAVVEVLIGRGIPPQRLSAAGYGEFAPVVSNAAEAGRAKNRRIEIVLLAEQEAEAAGKTGKALGEAGPVAAP